MANIPLDKGLRAPWATDNCQEGLVLSEKQEGIADNAQTAQ